MPVNVSPAYAQAELEYLNATSPEEKIEKLKNMIREMPGHKGAESLRAQLRSRLKRFQEQLEKSKKSGKNKKVGIRKEDMQAMIVGKTNSGKSSLLSTLTNAHPKTSQNKFTTTKTKIGMMPFESTSIQLIEVPAIESEYYDKGIVYTSDVILMVVTNLEELNEIKDKIRTQGKKIIVFNKIDLLSENEKRKLKATLKSKYRNYKFVLTSIKTLKGIDELKEKLFQSFGKIRVYTREPGKKSDKKRPMIFEPGATVKDVAEKILKGFSKKVKQIRIWGPSSKFSGQIVSLKHKLKDLDIVEFKTK